ncbi:EAL domain-containing protein [Neiella marina]|uniref:EAL domain-containing protein n=1 Tax=Neiella marina TaxID=508461 RepID=UPI000B3C0C13|nr:EAL domain-containing protein [Neiella marina]
MIPTLSSYLLAFTSRLQWLHLVKGAGISHFLKKHINLVLPFAVVFILVSSIMPYIAELFSMLGYLLVAQYEELSMFPRILTRIFVSQLTWMTGVHGEHIVNMIDGMELGNNLMIAGMPMHTFMSTFVHLGGSGSTWGLILACLVCREQFHEKNVAKLSVPLAVFNVNETLIYGIPIVFNVYFLVPFVFAPMVNAFIAYHVLQTGWLPFTETERSWVTPVLLDAWFMSQSGRTVFFQMVLIVISTAIYYPFVRLSIRHNATYHQLERLRASLSVNTKLDESLEDRFIEVQQQNQMRQSELNQVLQDLEHGELELHYQPKISLATGLVSGFEALVRLRHPTGDIAGPYFLPTLREHNLINIIDWWVINRVSEDLDKWAAAGYHPKVSLNIDPIDLHEQTVEQLEKAMQQFPKQVEVEIIESSYISNQVAMDKMIERLVQSNISTAMDDFGTGYSNIAMLARTNIQTIKLDKSLLEITDEQKGLRLYEQLVVLCKQLGFHIVAEGVETQQQLDFLRTTDVDEAQGWLYAKAMPFQQAHQYMCDNQSKVLTSY